MNTEIFIIGGYGEVGKKITQSLIKMGTKVLIGGRSEKKAKAFIETLSNPALINFYPFDLNDKNAKLPKNIKLVIMCAKLEDTDFIKTCILNGIHYLDITAETSFLNKVELLKNLEHPKAIALISVGLAPGLTNLLVSESMQASQNIDFIEIGVLLGLGDTHGTDAITWTINNLLKGEIQENKRSINFSSHWKKRNAYAFNFSDQYALMKTYPAIKIRTYLAFSSSLLTGLIFSLRLPLIKNIVSPLLKFLSPKLFVEMGNDRGYSIQAQSFYKNQAITGSQKIIIGENESLITGATAAVSALKILEGNMPKGVFHIHEVLELKDIIKKVEDLSGCSVFLK